MYIACVRVSFENNPVFSSSATKTPSQSCVSSFVRPYRLTRVTTSYRHVIASPPSVYVRAYTFVVLPLLFARRHILRVDSCRALIRCLHARFPSWFVHRRNSRAVYTGRLRYRYFNARVDYHGCSPIAGAVVSAHVSVQRQKPNRSTRRDASVSIEIKVSHLSTLICIYILVLQLFIAVGITH